MAYISGKEAVDVGHGPLQHHGVARGVPHDPLEKRERGGGIKQALPGNKAKSNKKRKVKLHLRGKLSC